MARVRALASSILLAVFIAGAVRGASAQGAGIQKDIPALKDAFAGAFEIGAAVEPFQLSGPTADLLVKHFGCLVAENVMKPVNIHPAEDAYYWLRADKIVQFAADHGMAMRYHTLIWHNQNPDWFFYDAAGREMTAETDPAKREANKALLLKRVESHVATVVGRYKDRIASWDVVNEVMDPSGPGGYRDSKWYKIAGPDYIATAFRAARAAGGPGIKLYITDYGTDEPARRDALYGIVKDLLAKGVPVDGVGHQTHIDIKNPPVKAIGDSIRLFAGLGLDNQITELDISVYASATEAYSIVPPDLVVDQGRRYKELFDELRSLEDSISSVTFWGVADDHSWLHNRPIPRRDAPFAFDEKFQAKPAYWGMVDPSKLSAPR
jgi:endo-1,4-beta-xylanase